jgi:methyltransferase (TIGR00027 family)
MRDGKPSFTAAAVAAARGVARVDPIAAGLVDGALYFVVRAAGSTALAAAAVNVATLGLVDHVELRTRALDAALRAGVAAGIGQVVVLGAGLDARGWRLPELAGALVFEVDHPSTQAYKRARVEAREPAARAVRFVPVDFERDDLGAALARAGHDASARTFWLWEGVTPYLPLEAVRATLRTVGERSAPASRVAVTYGTPRASVLGERFVRAALLGFRMVGEPIVGLLEPAAMHAELERAGFRVDADTSPQEWAERYGGARRRVLLLDERIAVGVSDARPRA